MSVNCLLTPNFLRKGKLTHKLRHSLQYSFEKLTTKFQGPEQPLPELVITVSEVHLKSILKAPRSVERCQSHSDSECSDWNNYSSIDHASIAGTSSSIESINFEDEETISKTARVPRKNSVSFSSCDENEHESENNDADLRPETSFSIFQQQELVRAGPQRSLSTFAIEPLSQKKRVRFADDTRLLLTGTASMENSNAETEGKTSSETSCLNSERSSETSLEKETSDDTNATGVVSSSCASNKNAEESQIVVEAATL